VIKSKLNFEKLETAAKASNNKSKQKEVDFEAFSSVRHCKVFGENLNASKNLG